MLLLLAGQVGPWVSLQDARRQAHEMLRADRAAEIARRAPHKSPTDDATDWGAMGAKLDALTAAVKAHATLKVREIVSSIVAATAGALLPLGPYEPDPDLDGIRVRFRKLSVERGRLLLAEAADYAAQALDRSGVAAVLEADEASHTAIAAFVAESVAELDGVSVHTDVIEEAITCPLSTASLDALRHAGIIEALFVVARAFQGLPAKKALRFGLPQPSTSRSGSTADGAQSDDGSSSGALAAPHSATSLAPPTRPIAAPDGTSRTTAPTSPPSSLSDALQGSTQESRPSTS